MNTRIVWIVHTPILDDKMTFGQAINHFHRLGREMGIELEWRKGKGPKNGQPRYHRWQIDNAVDATAFFLAHGNKMTEQRAAGDNE